MQPQYVRYQHMTWLRLFRQQSKQKLNDNFTAIFLYTALPFFLQAPNVRELAKNFARILHSTKFCARINFDTVSSGGRDAISVGDFISASREELSLHDYDRLF